MEKDFDLGNIGKKMPYRVPDGFFLELERRILAEAGPGRMPVCKKPRQHYGKIFASAVMAAAAALVLFAVLELRSGENGIREIDKAFAGLDTEDQEYLLGIYENEIYYYYR